eukprot:Pgem_evm1s118
MHQPIFFDDFNNTCVKKFFHKHYKKEVSNVKFLKAWKQTNTSDCANFKRRSRQCYFEAQGISRR